MELLRCPPEADDCRAHRESLARVVRAEDFELLPGDRRVPGEQRLAVDEQAGVARRVTGKRDHQQPAVSGDVVRGGNGPAGGP